MARRYTESELIEVIENAPAESTRAAAQAALGRLRARKQGERGVGRARALLQGPTFGFGENIESAITGQPVEQIRQEMASYRQEEPVMSGVLELGGAIPMGAGIGAGLAALGRGGSAAAPTARALLEPRMLPQATMGGLEGALYGAGTAESGQELGGATIGAGLGAATGGLSSLLLGPLTRRLRPGQAAEKAFEGQISERMGRRPTPVEYGAMAHQARERPLETAAEIANVPKMAQTLSSLPTGGVQQDIQERLTERARGASGRLVRLVRDLTGARGSYQRNLERLDLERQQGAQPLYNAAYAADFNPLDSPELVRQVEIGIRTGDLQRAYNKARKESMRMGEENIPTWTELSSAEDPTEMIGRMDLRTFDRFKQGLDSVYRSRARVDPSEAGSLWGYRQRLVSALDEVAPEEYRRAREAYAGPMRQIEAMEAGRAILRENADVSEAMVREFSEAEREAFTVAAVDAISQRLRSKPRRTGGVPSIPEYVEDRMRWAFSSDEDFEAFLDAIDAETDMQGFKNMILSRTVTADILAGQEELGRAGGMAEAGAELLQGNVGRAAQQTMATLRPARSSTLPGYISEPLAKLLFSQGPEAIETFRRMQRPAVMPQLLPPITTLEATIAANRLLNPQQ